MRTYFEGAKAPRRPDATSAPRVILGLDPRTQGPRAEAMPCALGPRVKPEDDTDGKRGRKSLP